MRIEYFIGVNDAESECVRVCLGEGSIGSLLEILVSRYVFLKANHSSIMHRMDQ